MKPFLETIGDYGFFSWRVLREAFQSPFEFKELGRQIADIGTRSADWWFRADWGWAL